MLLEEKTIKVFKCNVCGKKGEIETKEDEERPKGWASRYQDDICSMKCWEKEALKDYEVDLETGRGFFTD